MTKRPSLSYNDYVIKDGRFIGEFERMYQDCDDPWHQDHGTPVSVQRARKHALSMLGPHQFARILDVGCGTGRFTSAIKRRADAHVVGIDISPTALRKAQSQSSDIDYCVVKVPSLPFGDATFDLVVAAQVLWYVLPDMESFFAEVHRVLTPEGRFLLIQHFYQRGEQHYGKEILGGLPDLLELLPFHVEALIEVDRFNDHQSVVLASVNPTRESAQR